MRITIDFDTLNAVSEADRAILLALAGATGTVTTEFVGGAGGGGTVRASQPRAATAAKPAAPADDATDEDETPAPAKKAAAKKAAAAPADDSPSDDQLKQASVRATEMVASGETKKVKAALATVGAARVSELTAKNVEAFLAALDED